MKTLGGGGGCFSNTQKLQLADCFNATSQQLKLKMLQKMKTINITVDITGQIPINNQDHYLCYQAMMLVPSSCPDKTECFQAAEYLTRSCE